MKRKFLAVVVTAAMVAGALPGIALAAPADEYKTETQETPDSQRNRSDRPENRAYKSPLHIQRCGDQRRNTCGNRQCDRKSCDADGK